MTDKNYDTLISSILNVSPNEIENVNVTSENMTTVIYLVLRYNRNLNCPFCGSKHYISNGFFKRQAVIDNDFIIGEKVILKTRRYRCTDCRKTFSDNKGIVPKRKKVSYKMILRIMELLKNSKMTFKTVGDLVGVSPQTVTRIFDCHTHIPRAPFPQAICIDEVYTKKNDYKNSKYSCIFYDFYNQTIIDVLPCRRKNYLSYYLERIDEKERDNVLYISIDMYQPYRDICRRYFKKVTICVDSFHVITHLNDDLNHLRIRIMNGYDPLSQEYYLLSRFRFLLFDRNINLDNKGKFNKKLNRILNYRQLLDMILSINPQLAEGYRLKEEYIMFNASADYDSAKEYLDLIIDDFIKADIDEFAEFITLQNNWKQEIINPFIRYRNRRLNSGVAESMNHIVSTLIYNTKGIRDSERRRKRIMYAVNKEGFIIR